MEEEEPLKLLYATETLGIVLVHLPYLTDELNIVKCLLYVLSAKLNGDGRYPNSFSVFPHVHCSKHCVCHRNYLQIA